MAITTACPRCTHENTFPDDEFDKQVNCKICFHAFKLKAPATNPPPLPSVAVKATPPTVLPVKTSTGPKSRVNERDEPKRKRRDEDDDEDVPRGRRVKKDESSSAAYWVLGILGGVLLLGCCVGSPLAFLFVRRAAPQPVPPFIQAPPPIVFPPPVVNPPIFFPPANAAKLNPADPNEMDKVLRAFQTKGPELQEALAWLKEADTNHPKRVELAKALEAQVNEELPNPFSNDHFFRAYFRWATKDNVPSLTRLARNPDFTVWDNHRRQQAMEALGKLKEVGAAELIAEKLPNIFDRDSAKKALTSLGPFAEPAVLKYLHHPDGAARDAARNLLRQYGTTADALVTRTITDLKEGDDPVRAQAVQWLAQTPALEKRKGDVARALDVRISERNLDEHFLRALERWATSENVPRLMEVLREARLGRKDVIVLLGTLKDTRALPVLAGRISNFFDGKDAQDVLKQFGKEAEPAVVPLLGSNDRKLRIEAARLLGFIGTSKGSLPALTAAAKAFPQDREFLAAAQQSAVAISNRP